MGGLPDNTGGFDRRVALYRLGALGLLLAPLAGGCGHANGMPTMGDSGGSGSMPSWMMDDGMMDPAMMGDMQTIMDLLSNHQLIRRTVEDIDGGIRSVTTSADPRLAGLIRTHVAAMKTRIEQGHPIRHGDPLFREIFNHHTEIMLVASDVPEGIEVRETSTNPQVTLLIRQHARAAVSAFVAEGMPAAMRPTPLPPGYRP